MKNNPGIMADLGRVINQVSDVDEKLANRLGMILDTPIGKSLHNASKKIGKSEVYIDRKTFKERIKKHIKTEIMEMNDIDIECYPVKQTDKHSNFCHELCIGLAFDVYGSRRGNILGFKGVAEKLINHWKKCNRKTNRTLLITFSWDEVFFNREFKENFDELNETPEKSVAVVLLTPASLSLQYLK